MKKKRKVPGEGKDTSFRVVSGQLTVSDPTHEIGDMRQGVVDDAKKGTWISEAVVVRGKVKEIVAVHCDFYGSKLQWDEGFEEISGAGRVGIFDSDHYQNDKLVKKKMMLEDFNTDRPWVSMCGKVSTPFGAIPYGVVTLVGTSHYDFAMPYEIAIEDESVVGVRIRLDKVK